MFPERGREGGSKGRTCELGQGAVAGRKVGFLSLPSSWVLTFLGYPLAGRPQSQALPLVSRI